VTQRPTYKVDKFAYLPLNVEQELSNLINQEVEFFRASEEIRKELEKRYDFSTYGCFRAIDDKNEGDINPDNLRQFFKNNGYYPTEDEVIAIVRRLDVDADCKISYEEFSEGIKTQEFTKKKQEAAKSPSKMQESQLSYSKGDQSGYNQASGYGGGQMRQT